CVGREVSLGEQQVEDRLYGRQTRRELIGRELVELERKLAESSSGATEALVHIRLGREETLGDLGDVETAQRLESDHELRIVRDRFVAAGEQHPQEIVANIS